MNGSGVFWNGRRSLPADRQLISSVREEIVAAAQPVTRSSVAAALRAGRGLLAAGGAVGLADRIYAELGGLGPLQSLLGDPEVTDIHVNSPQEVWADRGSRLERVPLSFEDEGQLRALAVRLLAKAGKSLDESTPCLDARLPGGLRVHAVLPPISPPGTVLSIRIQRSRPVEVAEFLGVEAEAGASDPRVRTEVADLTRQIIASRCNFLISGATGSGKTTLLGALLGLCEQEERLVLIEDTAELAPVHPHIVRLESRPPNPEGRGALGLERLIFEALRMNPGRLIVGECRGAEVRELFTALNTGHSGGGTIHANSAQDVPARLAALGALAGWDDRAVATQAVSAIDVLLHLQRSGSRRQLRQIAVLDRSSTDLRARPALVCEPLGWARGPAWAQLMHRLGR